MQVGLEFEALLGQIWVDFESKSGDKLEPRWHQNLKKVGQQKLSKKGHSKRVPSNPEPGGLLALKNSPNPGFPVTEGHYL